MDLKRIFRLYIQSSLHVGIAAMSMSYVSSYYLKIPAKIYLHIFIFFSTVVSYNLIKHNIHIFKTIKYINFLCGVGTLFILYFFNIFSLIVIGGAGLICLLYVYPMLKGKKSLRQSGGLIKVISVAISWSIITVMLPFVEAFSWKTTLTFWLFFSKVLLFIFILMIPFEIRDTEIDHTSTLSQTIEIKKLKIIGFALLIIFLIIDKVDTTTIIITCSTTIAIAASTRKQSFYFSSFFVESLPIFWWILILFL